MFYYIIFGVILFSNLSRANCLLDLTDEDDSDPCEMLLESFAYATGNFTYCTIYYARPIRLCQLCYDKYSKVREVYNDISNIDPTGGQFCKDKLFNLDRLQVVDSGFQFVTTLWTRARCDSCYEKEADKIHEHLKPEVVKMLNYSDAFDACVKAQKNDSTSKIDPKVCTDCQPAYYNINHQYSILKGPSGEDDICMDIVDLVNRTRLDWSTTLGCYIYKKKIELVYLIITGLVSVIPVAFYFFTWCLITKKQQLVALQSSVPDYMKQIHRRVSNGVISR